MSRWLPPARLRWLAPLLALAAMAAIVLLVRHPLMPLYAGLLWHVLQF